MQVGSSNQLQYTYITLSVILLFAASAYRYSVATAPKTMPIKTSNSEIVHDLGNMFALPDTIWVNGKEVHDQGTVHTFTVNNESPNNVQIVDVQTSCGCLQAKLSKSNVPSHGTSVLSLSIAPEKVTDGPHKNWALLKTDTGFVWRYGITFHVSRAASWNRSDFHFADTSGVSLTEKDAEIVLTRPSFLQDLALKDVTCSSDLVKVQMGSATVQSNAGIIQERIPVKLVLTGAGVLSKVGSATLTATYVAAGRDHTTIATVRWSRSSPYVTEPGRLVIQSSDLQADSLTLKVSHAAGIPFQLVSTSLPDYLRLRTGDDNPATSHDLVFDVERSRLPKTHDFSNVVLRTDADFDNEIKVPVTYIHLVRSGSAESSLASDKK